jgi:hypothetical protein
MPDGGSLSQCAMSSSGPVRPAAIAFASTQQYGPRRAYCCLSSEAIVVVQSKMSTQTEWMRLLMPNQASQRIRLGPQMAKCPDHVPYTILEGWEHVDGLQVP